MSLLGAFIFIIVTRALSFVKNEKKNNKSNKKQRNEEKGEGEAGQGGLGPLFTCSYWACLPCPARLTLLTPRVSSDSARTALLSYSPEF